MDNWSAWSERDRPSSGGLIAGQTKTWQARIIEQIPDRRIAWVSTSGARNDGVVTFESISPERTRVSLGLDIEPEGPVEQIGDALGIVKKSIQDDLAKFKEFIESRGVETGAWRGSIGAGTHG